MLKRILLLTFFTIVFSGANGQVNWSNDVAGIIYGKCSNCHNTNGIAPFSLMSYFDAVDNSQDIENAVQSRHMPPWPPDPTYSRLAHERVLSQQEIDAVINWINSGMQRGDSTLEPAPPVFSSAEEITNPDLTLTAPSFTVNTTSDLYRCFVIPTGMNSVKYLTGMETVPGNRNIVHHVLIYADSTNVPVQLDAADPDPGYTSFGGTGSNASQLIGVWVPGQTATFTPAGMGIRLPANSNIILQIHYPGGISNQTDETKINLLYTSTPLRNVSIDAPLHHFDLDQGFLRIPANTTRTFTSNYTVPIDLSFMAVGPHMHLIGRSIRSWAVTPTNDTIPFIDIPAWDFHWQGMYFFPRVLRIPAGTTLYSSAFYDNTLNNPHNPSNPPVTVNLGEGTNDEMMLVYFQYTYYFPGDENIVIDSTVITSIPTTANAIVQSAQLYEPYPNPASGNFTIQYFLPANDPFTIELIDTKGQRVKTIEAKSNGQTGFYSTSVRLDEPEGIYFIRLISGSTVRTKQIVISK